jgi:phosphoenolpyruvate carboxylase
MATQHPDNAAAPRWQEHSPFIDTQAEVQECMHAYEDLNVDECMWDWEGKYADESIIDKLFSQHERFFRKRVLGRDIFLTFRIPNVQKERGYSLARALMVVLTSEDYAQDLSYPKRPLFELILPMTERAEQLMYVQKAFREIAHVKTKVLNHRSQKNNEYVELIPLVEGTDDQYQIGTLLEAYTRLHQEAFGKKPAYIRPFLARSDPALMSGHIACVLANKAALSACATFTKKYKIPTYPIIGAGSVIFRGGLSPRRVKQFIKEYAGVRTVTVQSAFRYDYPAAEVTRAIHTLKKELPVSKSKILTKEDLVAIGKLMKHASKQYESTLRALEPQLRPYFAAVPKRRERRQHIGLLGYNRGTQGLNLPRAITFAGACYSLGIPAEFFGTGAFLASLSSEELRILKKHYIHLISDLEQAAEYLNWENLNDLATKHTAWRKVRDDIRRVEQILSITCAPKTKEGQLHASITRQGFLSKNDPAALSACIASSGVVRRAIG